jgi:hypothetical protein
MATADPIIIAPDTTIPTPTVVLSPVEEKTTQATATNPPEQTKELTTNQQPGTKPDDGIMTKDERHEI